MCQFKTGNTDLGSEEAMEVAKKFALPCRRIPEEQGRRSAHRTSQGNPTLSFTCPSCRSHSPGLQSPPFLGWLGKGSSQQKQIPTQLQISGLNSMLLKLTESAVAPFFKMF